MATLVSFAPKMRNHLVATINVLDDELMMLENGTPQAFLGFAQDPSRPPATPTTFAGAFLKSGRAGVDESGRMANLLHAHRSLRTDPLLHVAGTGSITRALDSGVFCTLFYYVKVHLTDGRVL